MECDRTTLRFNVHQLDDYLVATIFSGLRRQKKEIKERKVGDDR